MDNTIENALPTTAEPFYSPLVNEEVRSSFARSVDQSSFVPISDSDSSSSSNEKAIKMMKELPIFSYESFISRTWALVVVSAAIFGFLASLWMLVYVFQKMCDGTLAGNQTMGVILLLGVMLLFASVIPWLLPPNRLICALRHTVHPLLLVLCFSVLLVKSMQLRSLVTIGLGGTIPQVNQVLSLLFMLVVQIVIAAEWYLATSPIGVHIIAGYPECSVSPSRFLLLHLYPTVLLLLTFFYGVSVLKVKRNFNEGRWITCAAAFILPIFAAWPVVYYFAPAPFHDPSVAVSVVAVAGVLLSCVFLPKMHTISLQSRIKQASDLSRTHSDATVYTGFSDYAALSSGSKPLYPVYGYTTNHFVPHLAAPLSSSSSKSRKSTTETKKKKSKHHHYYNGNFRNINYVPSSHSNSNNNQRVKSYSEWSREYEPAMNSQHHRIHRRIDLEPPPRHQQQHQDQTVYSISNQHHNGRRRHHEDAELLGLPPPPVNDHKRRHRRREEEDSEVEEPDNNSFVKVSHRLTEEEEIETELEEISSSHKDRSRRSRSSPMGDLETEEAGVDDDEEDLNQQDGGYFDRGALNRFRHRRRHSQSPSDGMILTASGLTDSTAATEQPSPGYTVSEVFLTH